MLFVTTLLLCFLFHGISGGVIKSFDFELEAALQPNEILKNAEEPIQRPFNLNDEALRRPRTGEHIIVDEHNFTVGEYLWSGRTGHYYDVPAGWPGWEGEVVAKEFYIWYYPHELEREVKYLSRVGQFIGESEYEDFRWLIMQKPPGVHLTKTRAFKEAFQKSRKECDDVSSMVRLVNIFVTSDTFPKLVEGAHGPAFMEILNLLRKHGIYHLVSNDRMLWDDNAQNPKIFDMGDDEERDPEKADDPLTVSDH
ncbi:hypothetical protein M422DRAFT_49380 [Sphaerobolus stellatus SS14]|uniref:Uncharacterized protein n=1 Tax=Sphaerobolus stellatus (strain SS14) TaxID=990650 RepID=A0A0C9VPS4_SPHS4|nr:hypothetical protein M422DRAFT_49380 [Sphaerobolus stellatus SS14]